MRKYVIFALIWVSLSVFNFGAVNAQVKYEQQGEFAILHKSRRDNLGFIVTASCLIPPIEFVTSLLRSNFLEHGWTLENWQAAQ